jgi:hypothetical protein
MGRGGKNDTIDTRPPLASAWCSSHFGAPIILELGANASSLRWPRALGLLELHPLCLCLIVFLTTQELVTQVIFSNLAHTSHYLRKLSFDQFKLWTCIVFDIVRVYILYSFRHVFVYGTLYLDRSDLLRSI